ncbi:hypothetical protein RDI58_020079 [Solanum bulbocastanum]|uniref:Uncharacterized protein n=1 Tax=Solanum bulbocastanum TaxID=147425 RepID=A0AAN8T5R2_SOLBU
MMSCASTIVEYKLQHTEFLSEDKDNIPTTIDLEETLHCCGITTLKRFKLMPLVIVKRL